MAGKFRKSWISDVSVFLEEEVFDQDNYVSSPNISGGMKEAIKRQSSMQAFPDTAGNRNRTAISIILPLISTVTGLEAAGSRKGF